jgi:hypothetical protein
MHSEQLGVMELSLNRGTFRGFLPVTLVNPSEENRVQSTTETQMICSVYFFSKYSFTYTCAAPLYDAYSATDSGICLSGL